MGCTLNVTKFAGEAAMMESTDGLKRGTYNGGIHVIRKWFKRGSYNGGIHEIRQ